MESNSSLLIWLIGVAVGGFIFINLILVIQSINKRMAQGGARKMRLKQFKTQMDKWKEEGYDVSSLEDLFK